MKKNDKKIVTDFFGKCLKRFGDSVHSLAWESDFTQKTRFAVLSQVADLHGAKILDVGCGKADLYAYLAGEGIDVDYSGVDITLGLVNLARKNYPEIELYYRDFMDEARYPEVDYAISSGIGNIRIENNRDIMESVIKKMFTMSRLGAAVNMLSQYSEESVISSGLMYFYSPEEMFSFAKKLTSNVILRHDYMENDFTLYLYK